MRAHLYKPTKKYRPHARVYKQQPFLGVRLATVFVQCCTRGLHKTCAVSMECWENACLEKINWDPACVFFRMATFIVTCDETDRLDHFGIQNEQSKFVAKTPLLTGSSHWQLWYFRIWYSDTFLFNASGRANGAISLFSQQHPCFSQKDLIGPALLMRTFPSWLGHLCTFTDIHQVLLFFYDHSNTLHTWYFISFITHY